jgi:hypothetical protein
MPFPPLRQADQQRDIGRVIKCSVVNPVAVHRLAIAVAVEVSGKDDGLVGELRI